MVPAVKSPSASSGDVVDGVRSLGQEDPLEEDTATHASILAWRIPRTEEPGGLQSSGCRVVHDGGDLACMQTYYLSWVLTNAEEFNRLC